MIWSPDMYASAGVGVLALLLGMLFTRIIPFLKRFCIPVPVSGVVLYTIGNVCLDGGKLKVGAQSFAVIR